MGGKEVIDCEGGVVKRSKATLPNGAETEYVEFESFNPEQMVECTKLTQGKQGYCSVAYHDGVKIIFSRREESPNMHLFNVSLGGGSSESKQVVLEQFQSMFGEQAEEHKMTFQSDAPKEEAREDFLYIWRGILTDEADDQKLSDEEQSLSPEDEIAEGLKLCEDFTVEEWQEIAIDWPDVTKTLVSQFSGVDHEKRRSLKGEETEGDVVLAVIFGLSNDAFNRLTQALAANEFLSQDEADDQKLSDKEQAEEFIKSGEAFTVENWKLITQEWDLTQRRLVQPFMEKSQKERMKVKDQFAEDPFLYALFSLSDEAFAKMNQALAFNEMMGFYSDEYED